MAKRKDIDKIRACAMAIVMISCFKKMARDLRLRNKAQIYICAGPGLHGTGDAVFDSLLYLGGAMTVSVVATTDISRGFCEQFFIIVRLRADERFVFLCF